MKLEYNLKNVDKANIKATFKRIGNIRTCIMIRDRILIQWYNS